MGFFAEWRDFIGNFLAGAFAGGFSVTASHPFDTINVRMQMAEKRPTILKTMIEMYKKEGFFSYYKGMLSPLLVSLPLSAVIFSSYESYLRWAKVDTTHGVPLTHCLIGGMFAGFMQSFIVCPADVVKCVMQLQYEWLPKKYTGSIDCFKKIYLKGGLRANFKGMMATFARDVPQYAVFFATFEMMKQGFCKYYQRNEMSLVQEFIAGSAAGLTCIMASYPQEIIKTRIMIEVEVPQAQRKYKSRYFDGGVTACISRLYRKKGPRIFWRGFNASAIHYITACAAQLVGYENCKNQYMKLTSYFMDD